VNAGGDPDAPGRAAFIEAFDVPRETLARLETYATLLRKWQARLNLVGPKTLPDLWSRHFHDSAQLLPLVAAHRPGGLPARWLDMGAGAGFPGLVIAIMGGGAVDLVESDRRKCAFLNQVIRDTRAPARVHAARLESLAPFAVDIITARAFAPLETLLAYAAPHCAPTTEVWLLKGKDAQEELTRARRCWTVDCESYPSATGQGGRILRIRNLDRASHTD